VHPILANRSRTFLYIGAWLPIAALLAYELSRGGAMEWGDAALLAFPMCLVYAFICQASWYLCYAAPLRQTDGVRLVATHLTAAGLSAAAWAGAGWIWAWVLASTLDVVGITARYTANAPTIFFFGVLLFLFAVALNYVLIAFQESQRAESRALELQVLAREAELKALRAQVDPHFLFNSLNSINALIMADPNVARRMCVRLAEFLRGSLNVGSQERIPFAEELRLAECYLDIERVRLGERLQLQCDIDPDCETCLVPPLIIQPLVENAIVHGVAPSLEGGLVVLQVQRNGAGMKIVIENPVEEEARSNNGSGMGLKNVNMRLANLYNGAARLDVTRSAGRFRVEMQLPCDKR
jgi:hypothetical protein